MDSRLAFDLANSVACWLRTQPLSTRLPVSSVIFSNIPAAYTWVWEDWQENLSTETYRKTVALCMIARFTSLCMGHIGRPEVPSAADAGTWIASLDQGDHFGGWLRKGGFAVFARTAFGCSAILPCKELQVVAVKTFALTDHYPRIDDRPLPDLICDLPQRLRSRAEASGAQHLMITMKWFQAPLVGVFPTQSQPERIDGGGNRGANLSKSAPSCGDSLNSGA
jgi:hypothetical protein